MSKPDLDDYIALFSLYGCGLGEAYLEPEDERYRLLFEQMCHLLAQPSSFNLTLPEPFRVTAKAYLAGDEAVTAHMRMAENRNFMISDVSDFIELGALRRRTGTAQQ